MVVTRPRSNVTTMYEPMVVLLNTGVVTRPRSNVTTIRQWMKPLICIQL